MQPGRSTHTRHETGGAAVPTGTAAKPGVAVALLAFAIVSASPSVAGAQTPDTTSVDSTRALPLPPVVVTASRAPLRADRLGFVVTAVDRAQLERRRPAYVADALRTVPGAFIEEAAGPGGPTIVRLRGGEEVFTQVLVDGVQINENGGFFDFQGLALSNLERIEVARGPQSALYGSSAVSGVVQFLTRRGQPGPARFDVLAEGGDATEHGGGYRATASVLGGSDVVRYSAGAGTAFNRGIFAVPHDTRSADASVVLDIVPSDRFDASANVRWIDVEGNLPVRDPGATRVPLDPNARNERTRVVASAGARFAATDAWTHEVRASVYREDFLYDDERDDVPPAPDFFVFDANFTLDSERQRTTLEYAGTLRGGDADRSATLSYGVQWQREELEDTTYGDFGPGHLEFDRNSTAGFAEVTLRPASRVSLLGGVRLERFEGLDAEWTPRGSIVVDLVPGTLALRAAAGRAYKAPNLQQQYTENPFIQSNPDLEPETSTSWEAGGDARIAGGRVTVGLTYFRQRFENLIRTVQSDTDPEKQINRNLGASRAHGIEWNVALLAAPGWTVGTEGAWVETEVLDNSGLDDAGFPIGEELPFRPSTVGSAYVDGTVGRLALNARATFVGEQTVLTERFSGRRERLDAYALLGLTATWRLSTDLSLYTRLDNLLDTEYDAAFDRPGIPLTAALGLRFSH